MDTNTNKTLEEEIMDENFDPSETMDNIQDLMQKANTGCPVHKINFSVESTSSYAGLYLMTLNDPEKMLKEIGDFDNLTDETYLYFEPRHIMETAQLLYGVLHMLATNGHIKKSDINPFIKDVVTRISYCTYTDFKEFLSDTLYRYGWQQPNRTAWHNMTHEDAVKNAALSRFRIIFKYIWFVPYVKIDELAATVVQDYQKRHPADNNEATE